MAAELEHVSEFFDWASGKGKNDIAQLEEDQRARSSDLFPYNTLEECENDQTNVLQTALGASHGTAALTSHNLHDVKGSGKANHFVRE